MPGADVLWSGGEGRRREKEEVYKVGG